MVERRGHCHSSRHSRGSVLDAIFEEEGEVALSWSPRRLSRQTAAAVTGFQPSRHQPQRAAYPLTLRLAVHDLSGCHPKIPLANRSDSGLARSLDLTRPRGDNNSPDPRPGFSRDSDRTELRLTHGQSLPAQKIRWAAPLRVKLACFANHQRCATSMRTISIADSLVRDEDDDQRNRVPAPAAHIWTSRCSRVQRIRSTRVDRRAYLRSSEEPS
jgi:hypothetical protein